MEAPTIAQFARDARTRPLTETGRGRAHISENAPHYAGPVILIDDV